MDIMMPEMDGLDRDGRDPHATRAPREAADHRADRQGDGGRPQQCLEAGANDYISKPLDVDKLLSLCRVWMRQGRRVERASHEPHPNTMNAATQSDFDIELQLLLDAIYLKYHHDFRHYCGGVAAAPPDAGAATTSAARRSRSCRSASCTTPTTFSRLLQFLTVQVSDMFRDPAYFLALREQVCRVLRTYPSLKVWVAGCSTGEEV